MTHRGGEKLNSLIQGALDAPIFYLLGCTKSRIKILFPHGHLKEGGNNVQQK